MTLVAAHGEPTPVEVHYLRGRDDFKLVARCAVQECGRRATGAVDIGSPIRHARVQSWCGTLLLCGVHEARWSGHISVAEWDRIRRLCDLPVTD